jgi:hypothetical protein
VGEHYPDTVGVTSSTLVVPTMDIKDLVPPLNAGLSPFSFLLPPPAKKAFFSL